MTGWRESDVVIQIVIVTWV